MSVDPKPGRPSPLDHLGHSFGGMSGLLEIQAFLISGASAVVGGLITLENVLEGKLEISPILPLAGYALIALVLITAVDVAWQNFTAN